MEDILVTEEEKENLSALDFMLVECFPKDKKRSDGRLCLHAAPSRRVRF
jgi:hypothetical protein